MPRAVITTTFTPRTKPTTSYSTPRITGVPVSFDSTEITFDSTLFTWDQTITGQLITLFTTPRKVSLLELENGVNFDLEDGTNLQAEGGTKDNIIDTFWS